MQGKLEYFKIGKIVTTRGLKGDVKVYSHTDNIERFLELEYFFIDKDKETKYYVEKASIISGNMVVLKIRDFDTIESVQKFIDKFIYIDRDNVYSLDEDEILIVDMIGMDVFTDSGEKIGVLEDVLQYSANDVYIVKSPEGKEYLIPATYEVVPIIDVENKKMVVKPIPGLLD